MRGWKCICNILVHENGCTCDCGRHVCNVYIMCMMMEYVGGFMLEAVFGMDVEEQKCLCMEFKLLVGMLNGSEM